MEPIKNARLGVVGGRDFTDYKYLAKVLDAYRDRHGISWIVSGGANGTDSLARRYARSRQIYGFSEYYAQWDLYGNSAGMIRNKIIVEQSEVLIAFPTENSVGTWSTVNYANIRKIPVYVMGNWG